MNRTNNSSDTKQTNNSNSPASEEPLPLATDALPLPRRKPAPLPPLRPLKDVVLAINDSGILYHLRKAVQNDISHVVLHLKMPHIQAEHGYALRCVEITTDLPVYVKYRIVEADPVVFNVLREVDTLEAAYAALEELRPSIRRGWPLELYDVYENGSIDGVNLLKWSVRRTS